MCSAHSECLGFVRRTTDGQCGTWKKGPLSPKDQNNHDCHRKVEGNNTYVVIISYISRVFQSLLFRVTIFPYIIYLRHMSTAPTTTTTVPAPATTTSGKIFYWLHTSEA